MVQRKRRSIIKMAKLPPAVLDVLREEPEVAIPVAVAYRGYQSYQGINSIYEHITGQDNNTIHDTGSLPENFDYKSLNNANTYIASGPPPRFATHAPQPEDVSAEEKKPLIPPAGGTNNVSGPGPENTDTTIDILPSSRGTDNAPTLRRRIITAPPPPEQVPLVRSRGFNGSYGQSRGPFPNIGNATTALGAAGLAAAVVASNLGGGGVTPSTDVPPTTQDPLIPFTPPRRWFCSRPRCSPRPFRKRRSCCITGKSKPRPRR